MTTTPAPAPNRGGRPPVGDPIQVRLPAWMLAAIDTERGEQSRAEFIRTMIARGIAANDEHRPRCPLKGGAGGASWGPGQAREGTAADVRGAPAPPIGGDVTPLAS